MGGAGREEVGRVRVLPEVEGGRVTIEVKAEAVT